MTKRGQGAKSSTTRIRTKDCLIALLLFRVQNQINELMVVNCLPKKQHRVKGLSLSLLLSILKLAQEQW